MGGRARHATRWNAFVKKPQSDQRSHVGDLSTLNHTPPKGDGLAVTSALQDTRQETGGLKTGPDLVRASFRMWTVMNARIPVDPAVTFPQPFPINLGESR